MLGLRISYTALLISLRLLLVIQPHKISLHCIYWSIESLKTFSFVIMLFKNVSLKRTILVYSKPLGIFITLDHPPYTYWHYIVQHNNKLKLLFCKGKYQKHCPLRALCHAFIRCSANACTHFIDTFAFVGWGINTNYGMLSCNFRKCWLDCTW